MQLFKPSFALLAIAMAAAPLVAAAPTVTSEMYDTEAYRGKPKNPLFACVIKSRSCYSTTNYTDLTYKDNFKLGVCHHDGLAKAFLDRLSVLNDRGMFFNTFYVSCDDADDDCQRKAEHLAALDLTDVSST